MSRKAIIIWGIVITVAVIGIVITYILLNNGFSNSNQNTNTGNNNTENVANNNNLPTEENIDSIEQAQGSGDYYYWSIMPIRLQSKLPNPRNSSSLDYYLSLIHI